MSHDEEDREKWNRWEFDLGDGQVVVEVPADLTVSEAYEVDEFFRLIVRSLLRRALDAKEAGEIPVPGPYPSGLPVTNETAGPVEVRLSNVEDPTTEKEETDVH